MKISFNIEYRTSWGETVCIDGLETKSLFLHTTDGIYWQADYEIDVPQEGISLCYNYRIERDGVTVRHEWKNVPRTLRLMPTATRHYIVCDSWKEPPPHSYLYSSAFTEVLRARLEEVQPRRQDHRRGLIIRAAAPGICHGYRLALCGNQPLLADWDADKALPMQSTGYPEWQIELDADRLHFPLEYKFVRYNEEKECAEGWELNPNRHLARPELKPGETLVISDRYARFDLPEWRGAGVAIPIFSLRSEGSFGIGDFGDLKRLVDWAAETGQQVIQILPVNDTTMTHTWTDSYPYNSISIYAFHPLYADLRQMGTLHDVTAATRLAEQQRILNNLPSMDYEAVSRAKWKYFHLLFAQEGQEVLASDGFRTFFTANEEWLKPYAVYCYLRDAYRTPDFHQWTSHATYDAREIEQLCHPGTADYPHVSLYFYLQYHLHLQLSDASAYARSRGIVLKGDIPIGISCHSVEAWTEPYYFNLNGQAGAPPDDFSVNGQNWGFPTYNWEVMEQDGYRWWMKRFRKMAEYFDAYRIDHILGFFRIWEIPTHAVHGLLGQFAPALPMSRAEIEGFGLPFREEFLLPCIRQDFLPLLFGPYAERARQEFLLPISTAGSYRLKPEFETQRQVAQHFATLKDEESHCLRDGLYALISNVLFVPDKDDATQYHPRVGALRDLAFRLLEEPEKEAFSRLYEHYFYHRHNEFWHHQAMKKLPQLTQSTRMLVCGEDLGMIPGCVAPVMDELRILSLEIQRMPKSPMREFDRPAEYPYRSVCTISTHDMSTLRGWWEEDALQTQRYCHTILGHYGDAPAVATPQICEEVVRQHLEGRSMLCILSLQDWMAMDGRWRHPNATEERINIPANPRHYWRYRMHLTLEQLMEARSLNEKIRTLIMHTGRTPELHPARTPHTQP